MKKLIALVAMIAMVSIASVAQADDVAVNASIAGVNTVTGCTSVALTPTVLTKSSDTCAVTYVSNAVAGFIIDYTDSTVAAGGSLDLDSAGTSDAIAILPSATASATGCVIGDAGGCWSWGITTNPTSATVGTDDDNGATAFNSGEHDLNFSDEAVLETQIVTHNAADDDGFTMTFYATVDSTTATAADYTNNTTLTIT